MLTDTVCMAVAAYDKDFRIVFLNIENSIFPFA